MKTSSESTDVSPPACRGCADQRCATGQAVQKPPMEGLRLVLASAACFLLPLLLALAGTVFFRFSATAQLFGAIAGLVVGMVAWGLIARLFQTTKEAA